MPKVCIIEARTLEYMMADRFRWSQGVGFGTAFRVRGSRFRLQGLEFSSRFSSKQSRNEAVATQQF